MFWCIVICICDCLLIRTCSCIYLCDCIICTCIGQQQYHHCIRGEGCSSLPPFSSGINEPLRLASPCQSPTEAFFHLIRKRIKKMPLLISLLSRLLSTKGGLISDTRKKISSFSSFSSLSRDDNHILILTQINKQKKVIISLSSQQIRLSKEANRIIIARPSLSCTSMILHLTSDYHFD